MNDSVAPPPSPPSRASPNPFMIEAKAVLRFPKSSAQGWECRFRVAAVFRTCYEARGSDGFLLLRDMASRRSVPLLLPDIRTTDITVRVVTQCYRVLLSLGELLSTQSSSTALIYPRCRSCVPAACCLEPKAGTSPTRSRSLEFVRGHVYIPSWLLRRVMLGFTNPSVMCTPHGIDERF